MTIGDPNFTRTTLKQKPHNQARNPEREGERELRAPDPVTGLNLAGGRGEMSPRQWRRYCKKFRQPFHGHGNKR